MCQSSDPLLIQANGTILEIGSVAGEIPYVLGSAYNASEVVLFTPTVILSISSSRLRMST